MGLKNLFSRKKEALIGLDLGSSSVKLLSLDLTSKPPKLQYAAVAPVKGDIFSNNVIISPARISEAILGMANSAGVGNFRATTAVPGPSVFTKKIKVPKMGLKELDTNIQFEAGNFIPHNINAVKLDYHVLGESGQNQLEVLVVAVKNEIIDSFLNAIEMAGLGVAVVDVDAFALQNTFEQGYPELLDKTTALVNVGARYSCINICKGGSSLFTGDIAVGGRLFTDALVEVFGLSFEDAERMKVAPDPSNSLYEASRDILRKNVEHVATEFNRQLSFFWNASGSDEGIDHIFLSGGASLTPELLTELSDKTGIECELLDPFRGIEIGEKLDSEYVKSVAPFMGVGVGLALRQPADKIISSHVK